MPERNNPHLRREYLRWLEAQLKDEHSPITSYWELTNLMFDTEFDWSLVPMDENRVVDGADLRIEFANEFNVPKSRMLELNPVSFLEVLIGLSRRLGFVAGGSAPGWAWQLLGNLDMHRLSDPLTRHKRRRALEIMTIVIERKYQPNGVGGFFPLSWPDEDQTRVELWYQLNAFAEEIHPEH